MTELKTALAGEIPEVFVRSKVLIAAFRSASRSLGRWELAFMVETEVGAREPRASDKT